MQGGYTVYRKAVVDIDMRHMDHIVFVNDNHFFIRILSSYLIIKNFYDRYQLGYYLL